MKKSLLEQLQDAKDERKRLFKEIDQDSKKELLIVLIMCFLALLLCFVFYFEPQYFVF